MYFEENFITEEDAFHYCMKHSVLAFKGYEKVLEKRPVKLSYNNYMDDMPKVLADSIANNMKVDKYSKLKGHFARDIVRNIADTVVLDHATEVIGNQMPMQISFDKKGNPIGDAAIIFNEIVEGLECVQRGFGEEPSVKVDSKQVAFNECGNRSVALSPEIGVVAINRPVKTEEPQTL